MDTNFDLYRAFILELIGHAQRAALKVWRTELTSQVQAPLISEIRAVKPMSEANAMRALARYLDTSLYAELLRVIPPLLRDLSVETIASAPNSREIVFALAAEAGSAAGRKLIASDGIEAGANALAWLTDSELEQQLQGCTAADGENPDDERHS